MLAKTYQDDEYYTTEKMARLFFERVVVPSGLLRHRTILMPFTKTDTPLHRVAQTYHANVIPFDGNLEMWTRACDYPDVAVIDNPPFSLSATIEKRYIQESVPFVLFRSAITYPVFIFQAERAGVIYENSREGICFEWGFARHIQGDGYIQKHYPNLLDNLKHHGILQKRVPVGFSHHLADFRGKIGSVTFDSFVYPKEKNNMVIYMNRGVYDEDTHLYYDEKDRRVHALSYMAMA